MGGVCHALIFLFNLSSLSLSLNHDSDKKTKKRQKGNFIRSEIANLLCWFSSCCSACSSLDWVRQTVN